MSRHTVPFADTQYLSRTHSVFRAYGEDYAGRRLGILLFCSEGKSCENRRTSGRDADTQYLSRLRRGLRGQAAGNFAFSPGRGSPVERNRHFARKELSVIWADRPLFR